jgi:regulator of nucleoside diphosphate kinase
MLSTSMPPVCIPRSDYARLEEFAGRREQHPAAAFLLSELCRARILDHAPESDLIVCLDRWVTYRVDWEPPESKILVLSPSLGLWERHLSVLTPVGAALLGLHVGDRMPYQDNRGALHAVTVMSLHPESKVLTFRDWSLRDRSIDKRKPFDPGPEAA